MIIKKKEVFRGKIRYLKFDTEPAIRIQTRGDNAESVWFKGSIRDALDYISYGHANDVVIIRKNLYPTEYSNYRFIEAVYDGETSLLEW